MLLDSRCFFFAVILEIVWPDLTSNVAFSIINITRGLLPGLVVGACVTYFASRGGFNMQGFLVKPKKGLFKGRLHFQIFIFCVFLISCSRLCECEVAQRFSVVFMMLV